MDFINFINFIKSKGLYFDNQTLFLIYSAIVQRSPIILRGPAGTGKTELTKVIAEFLDAEYIFYQCTIGTTEEDLLHKIVPDESTKSGIKLVLGPLPEALKKSHQGKVVLVLDEFDKTRPTADALLLDFLQNYRISVRTGSDKIIQGNPENIFVFLTSNDDRDFSEPLLRRVVSIYLKPLKPEFIRKILESKGFGKDIVSLLTQLYRDTLKAGLRKPATVQELIQLGKAIEILGENSDWTSLVRAYVIKDDYDWQKFTEYLRNRDDYDDSNYSDNEEDITEYYEEVNETETTTEEMKEEETPRMPRLRKVTKTAFSPENYDDKEKAMILEFNENNYSTVIKEFKPEPTDDPTKFMDFRIVREGDKAWIVKDNPLRLKDVIDHINVSGASVEIYLRNSIKSAKIYIKNTVKLSNDFLEKLINSALKVIYYTKNILRFQYDGVDFVLIKQKDYGAYSEWQLELIYDGSNSKCLAYAIQQLIYCSTAYKASEKFTQELKKLAEATVIHTNAENRWDAKYEAKETEKFKELIRKSEEIKNRIFREFEATPVVLEYIYVEVQYTVGSTEVLAFERTTESENTLKQEVVRWLNS